MTLGARPHESDLDARRRRVDEWLGVPRDGYSSSPADGIVVPHATAASALRALKEQIDACTGPEDLIVLACWAFNKATFLDVGVTIEDSLRAASERGVPIRALFAHAAKLTVPRIGDGEWKISGGGADNTAILVTAENVEHWPKLPKAEVARRLAERIAARLAEAAE